MSQEKVNAYKEAKANRKANLEKERKQKKAVALGLKIAGIVAGAALVVALAVTGVNAYKNYQASRPNYDREEAVIYDMAGVLSEETEAETESGADAEAQAETEGSTTAAQ